MDTTGTQQTLDTPVAEFHRRAGAKLGLWFGCSLPDDFGDWTAEYRFAQKTVALIDKNYRAYLDFAGPDRVRYLNAILTNNIKDLRENHGTISLFLNPQGRILADIQQHTPPPPPPLPKPAPPHPPQNQTLRSPRKTLLRLLRHRPRTAHRRP